jgi:hypothetical protein
VPEREKEPIPAVSAAPVAPTVVVPVPEPVSIPVPPKSECTPAERAELERLAEEAEAAFFSLERKPLAETPQYDDPLHARKIEKLFKPSGSERSPFAS